MNAGAGEAVKGTRVVLPRTEVAASAVTGVDTSMKTTGLVERDAKEKELPLPEVEIEDRGVGVVWVRRGAGTGLDWNRSFFF